MTSIFDTSRGLSRGQAKFPRILSQMSKMTLKVKLNDIHFQYQPRVSQHACLVQIWWFQLKFVTSYRADKVKFTDRRTDGRRQRQYPFGLKGQGVTKVYAYVQCYGIDILHMRLVGCQPPLFHHQCMVYAKAVHWLLVYFNSTETIMTSCDGNSFFFTGLLWGVQLSSVDSPLQRRTLMFYFMLAWTSC